MIFFCFWNFYARRYQTQSIRLTNPLGSVLFLWLLTKQSLRRDDWFRLHILFTQGYVTPELIINSPHWRTHLLDLYNSFHYLTRSIIFPLLKGNRANLYIFDFLWWWWWYNNGFSCWFQAPKKENVPLPFSKPRQIRRWNAEEGNLLSNLIFSWIIFHFAYFALFISLFDISGAKES